MVVLTKIRYSAQNCNYNLVAVYCKPPEFSQIPIVHMNYIIEGTGALVDEEGEETPLKAGDFALVNPKGSRKETEPEGRAHERSE
jgi:hypothetical protein